MFNQEKIFVIQTGGTIDKDYPRGIGGYAFEICSPAVERIFRRAKTLQEIHVASACRKDSQDLTIEDRNNILKLCLDHSYSHVLITHGTDTVLETASFLATSRTLVTNKTVVITGAFRPEVFRDSDADFNVGMAFGALKLIKEPGIYVVLQGKVGLWSEFSRNTETGEYCLKQWQ